MNCTAEMLRLYAVTDRAWVGRQTLPQQVEAALKGGATCVQLREKHLDDADMLAEAKTISALCRAYHVPFILNDNVPLAKLCGADGVHVGQDDLSAAEARRLLGPDILFSVHCITKACACKTGNGFFCIVNSLNDSRTIKVVNYFFCLCSILSGKYKFCCSFTRNFDFCIFINITIRMTCNRNRLCPIFYIRNDSLNKDWCTKYRTI